MNTDERLTRIDDKLEQVLKCQSAQTEVCKARELRLDGLEGATYGNGRDGLRSEMVAVKKEVAQIKEDLAESHGVRINMKLAAVAGGISLATGGVLLVGQAVLQWVARG